MIEFRTLGGVDLRGVAGERLTSVLAHPRRTALLAYLTLAQPAGFHRRDTLVGLLWPDLGEERARASLRKAVHHLRRALGDEVLVGNGEEGLAIDPALLTCDAGAFERALDENNAAHASTVYGGALLAGFFLAEAVEFERWLEGERSRLRTRAYDAFWREAAWKQEQNQAFDAAMWGRRAAALVPDDETALRRLLDLLLRLGDHAGALAAYDDFAGRVRRDFDAEPSTETRAMLSALRPAPRPPAAPSAASRPQRIRYVQTGDGVKLAWADAGSGPLLIKAANWLTHLQYDLESPVWRHWFDFLAAEFRFVRYDERGCGMSDWAMGDTLSERWVDDLEAVVGAVRPTAPFALLGISQGAAACIGYAVRHPDRVSKLVLYGGYARGWARRGDAAAERVNHAIIELAHLGWGKTNPAFRQLFTSRFIPEASDEQIKWFNALCRRTTSSENAIAILETRSRVEITALLPGVRTPTLVLHARDDEVVPISEGRLLAAGIPGAQFVELDSRNHILLGHERAWAQFQEETRAFLGAAVSSARGSGSLRLVSGV